MASRKRKPTRTAASRKPKKRAAKSIYKKKPGRKPPSFQKKIARTATKEYSKLSKRAARELAKRDRQRKKKAKEDRKLQGFRAAVRKLQKEGVIDKKIDAKKAKPTKRLTKKIADFKPVIEGKATALKLSKPAWRRHYKEQGHVVKDGFAIIDNVPGHRYSVTDRGIKTSKLEGRYETTELPLSEKNLEKFLHELEFNKKFEKLKQPGERWAFRFYGNNSRRVFQTLRQLVDYISQYQTVEKALAKRARNRGEIINAIEIVRLRAGYTEDQWRQSPDKKRDFKEQNRAFKEKMGRRYTGKKPKRKAGMNRWQYWKKHEPLRYQDALRAARRRMRKLRKQKG